MKNKKNIIIFIVTLIALLLVSTISFADYSPEEFKSEITTDANGVQEVKDTGGKIVGMIRVIGTIAAVGIIMVLGVKYMIGSAEEKAEYKKTLMPYLIGAVFVFASTTITQVIYDYVTTANESEENSETLEIVRKVKDIIEIYKSGGFDDINTLDYLSDAFGIELKNALTEMAYCLNYVKNNRQETNEYFNGVERNLCNRALEEIDRILEEEYELIPTPLQGTEL